MAQGEDSRCVAKGLQSIDYSGTLGALALRPSGFCNIRVMIRSGLKAHGFAQRARGQAIAEIGQK